MGFPHSEISGSKCIGNSPELIAAYHVLHRLSVPRHPPNALIVLDLSLSAKRRFSSPPRLVPCRGRPPPRQRPHTHSYDPASFYCVTDTIKSGDGARNNLDF